MSTQGQPLMQNSSPDVDHIGSHSPNNNSNIVYHHYPNRNQRQDRMEELERIREQHRDRLRGQNRIQFLAIEQGRIQPQKIDTGVELVDDNGSPPPQELNLAPYERHLENLNLPDGNGNLPPEAANQPDQPLTPPALHGFNQGFNDDDDDDNDDEDEPENESPIKKTVSQLFRYNHRLIKDIIVCLKDYRELNKETNVIFTNISRKNELFENNGSVIKCNNTMMEKCNSLLLGVHILLGPDNNYENYPDLIDLEKIVKGIKTLLVSNGTILQHDCEFIIENSRSEDFSHTFTGIFLHNRDTISLNSEIIMKNCRRIRSTLREMYHGLFQNHPSLDTDDDTSASDSPPSDYNEDVQLQEADE